MLIGFCPFILQQQETQVYETEQIIEARNILLAQ